MNVIEKLKLLFKNDIYVIFTDNSTTMISAKRRADGGYSVRLHNMFGEAGDNVIKAVSDYIKGTPPLPPLLRGRIRDSREIIRKFISDNQSKIKSLPDRLRSCPPKPLYPYGRFFDLKEVFDRLNNEYFNGKITAKITWEGNVRNGRRYIRFGSYTEKDNIIRIHPSLDREDIPSYFIESIVYHEMLHKVVGARVVNGRRRVHTPEFKRMEKRFKDYGVAREWEKSNIRRLLKHYE